MYNKRKLSESKFSELKTLIQSAEKSNKEELDYLSSISVGLVNWHYKGKGDVSIEFFSPKRNKELEIFLRDNIITKNQNIISIHLLTYEEGSETLSHRDSNSSNTYLTLLQKSDEGGELFLENEIIPFEESEIVDYSGKTLHGVLKIKKGIRKTFCIWCRNSTII